MSQQPTRFEHFRRRASRMVQTPARVQKLVGQAANKLHNAGGDKFQELRQQVSLAIDLVRAWLSGEYRQVSQKTIIVVVAALLYFVVPLDVIPDFIFGWGLLDDMAVLGYVFSQLQDEIAAFRQFQTDQNKVDEEEV